MRKKNCYWNYPEILNCNVIKCPLNDKPTKDGQWEKCGFYGKGSNGELENLIKIQKSRDIVENIVKYIDGKNITLNDGFTRFSISSKFAQSIRSQMIKIVKRNLIKQ